MKLVSQIRSAFMKASGHPLFQKLNDNAAKATSVVFTLGDSFLTSMQYWKTGSMAMAFPPQTSAEWLTLSGGLFLLGNIAFYSVDRFNWMKRPIGVSVTAAGLCLGASAADQGMGMYVAAVAPILTGISLMFENAANSLSERVSGLSGKVARAAEFYLKYPVASIAGVHLVSSSVSLMQSIAKNDIPMSIYSAGWIGGTICFALTDNNMKEQVRANAWNAQQVVSGPSSIAPK